MAFEVISGGMIISEKAHPISVMAGYIQQAYKIVEQKTGIRFGADYLWHINNAEQSDWFPSSEKPAIALCIFKEYDENRQLAFAVDLQYSLHYEGRDLCDDEAYRHLLEKYRIAPDDFYAKLHNESYKKKAYEEFALCKQLQVTGFPQLFLQTDDLKLQVLAQGYTDYDVLTNRLNKLLMQREN